MNITPTPVPIPISTPQNAPENALMPTPQRKTTFISIPTAAGIDIARIKI